LPLIVVHEPFSNDIVTKTFVVKKSELDRKWISKIFPQTGGYIFLQFSYFNKSLLNAWKYWPAEKRSSEILQYGQKIFCGKFCSSWKRFRGSRGCRSSSYSWGWNWSAFHSRRVNNITIAKPLRGPLCSQDSNSQSLETCLGLGLISSCLNQDIFLRRDSICKQNPSELERQNLIQNKKWSLMISNFDAPVTLYKLFYKVQ